MRQYAKKEEGHKWWSCEEYLKCKHLFCKKRNNNNSLIKEKRKIAINLKFWKDF